VKNAADAITRIAMIIRAYAVSDRIAAVIFAPFAVDVTMNYVPTIHAYAVRTPDVKVSCVIRVAVNAYFAAIVSAALNPDATEKSVKTAADVKTPIVITQIMASVNPAGTVHAEKIAVRTADAVIPIVTKHGNAIIAKDAWRTTTASVAISATVCFANTATGVLNPAVPAVMSVNPAEPAHADLIAVRTANVPIAGIKHGIAMNVKDAMTVADRAMTVIAPTTVVRDVT